MKNGVPRIRAVAAVVAALLVVASPGCGGGAPVEPKGESSGIVSGRVVLPVTNGTVTVFKLDSSTVKRGEALGSATTDDTGAFSVSVPAYNGPMLVVASTGNYTEPATGTAAKLDGFELTHIIASYKSGTHADGVLVSPIATLATSLATHRVRNADDSLDVAVDEAFTHLNNHFAGVDWRSVVPADLTIERSVQLDDGAKAGLILAALSMQARLISESANVTPGSAVTTITVVDSLAADLSFDGYFDGVSGQGQIVLPRGVAVAPTPPTGTRLDDFTARTELSRALSLFLESDRNNSGIKAGDVLPLRDAISTDANPRLFRTGGAKDDDKAPTVSFSTSFALADGGTRAAVGANFLVNRSLLIVADATDPAGVKSLNVSIEGSAVPAGEQGVTTSHFIGTWVAADAGSLVISAQTSDLRGNSATVNSTVTVDLAAPQAFVVKPALPTSADGGTAEFYGFISGPLQVEATATDDQLLDVLTVEGLDGFIDNDTATTHVVGTWTAQGNDPDGLKSLSFRACDAVDNCSTKSVAFGVDRTAPQVTIDLISPPPEYTKNNTVSFSVVATDGTSGAGVKQVYASVNGANPPFLGVQSASDSDSWSFANLPLAQGRNVITVYADDLAMPSNSGIGTANASSFTVIYDVAAPTVTRVPVQSYVSEQAIDFQRNSDGSPVMPVAYTTPTSTKTDVNGPTEIFKLSQRLSCGSTTPTGSALETTNVNNLPFWQFAVNYDQATESPIVSARFRVMLQNQPSFEPAVDLVPAARTGTGQVYFDLPLCTELIPKLFQTLNQPMTVQIQVTDGAGNVGTSTFSTPVLRVSSPPVAVVEDANYASLNDAKSLYVYRRAAQNYQQLFDPANSALASGVRVLRYIIYNPATQPIAVKTVQTNGIHSLTESWQSATFALNSSMTGGSTYALDGQSFSLAPAWDSAPQSRASTACSLPAAQVYPCGAQNRDGNYPYHQVGSTTQFACRNVPLPPYATSVSIPEGQPFVTLSYLKPSSTAGGETTAADTIGTGYVLLPAASGNTPGKIVLYVTMPRATTSTSARAARPLLFQANAVDPALRYQYWYADFWSWTGQSAYQCGTTADTQLMQYAANRWYEQLQSATESVTYAHNVFTVATVPDANQAGGYALFGPTGQVITNASTTRSFNH